jgi:hypothetical protein
VKIPSHVKKGFKILSWIIGFIIGLFLLMVLLMQVPAVQSKIKDKVITYLEGKIQTSVRIGKIAIKFPKKIILEEVYFQSQGGDTLLYGKKIAVDISMFKLLDNEVEFNSVALNTITLNIKRDKDSVFNFDYIIHAFASKEIKNTKKSLKISLHNISLDNIEMHYNDRVTHNKLQLALYHFDTRLKVFDLDQMNFEVPKIHINGLKLKLKQGELVREIVTKTIIKTDSIVKTRHDLTIKLGIIDFRKMNISYDNAGTQLNSGLSLNKLYIDFKKTNLQKQQIDINRFELEGVKGGLTINKNDHKLIIQTLPAQKPPNWKLSFGKTTLKHVDFRFDDENATHSNKGIDYKHLKVKELQLNASDLNYTATSFSGAIHSFAIKEQSGLNVEMLQTNFTYSPQGVKLKKLYLKTSKTLLRNEIVITYPSLAVLKSNPEQIGISANLERSRIDFKDLLLLVPQLAQTAFFKNHQNSVASVHGRIEGPLKNIAFRNMEISGIGGLRLAATGRIIGLPDAKKAWYNLTIKQLQLGVDDIRQSIPPGLLPKTIQLPERVTLKGTFKGKADNFKTNLALNSTFGAAKVSTTLDYRIKNQGNYNGSVDLNDFDLGKLIKNPSIGKITLTTQIKGKGFDPKTAVAQINGRMSKGVLNGYPYRDLVLNGTIVNGHYNAKAVINDPNLVFDLVSEGDFGPKYPKVNMKLNVDIADLEKLNLHAGPLKLRGQVDAHIDTADLDYLNGKVTAHHLLFVNEKEQIQMDSITIIAKATAGKNSLAVQSQIIKATVDGQYQWSQVSTALMNSIERYYNLHPSAKKKITRPQQFAFTINIINDPVITKLLSEVKQLEPISIAGRYNSVNDTIIVNSSVPRLVYGSNTIINGFLKIDTKENTLVYQAGVDEIKNAQFCVPKARIEGTLADNRLAYKLQLRDSKNKEQYTMAGTIQAASGRDELHLFSKDLMLNYEPWTIAESNLLRFGFNGLYANDFELQNGKSSIKLQSLSDAVNAPLLVNFTDFDIATLSGMVQQEAVAFGGLINGNVKLEDSSKNLLFTADLSIGNFAYKKQAIGDISLKVNNRLSDTYAVNMTLSGQGNQMVMDGSFRNSERSFKLKLDMQYLNLSSIQPFTADQLTNSSGYVSGKFDIKGTIDKPKAIGELQFHDGAFTVTKLNSSFELLNDNIIFTEEGLVFKNFSLSDSEKNVLLLRGKIDTPNYRDFAFNVRVNANNFRVTNSTAKDNDLYYGKLYIDTRLRINGDLNKPIVDGNIKVNENTKFTIVLPQSDPAISDREGIVEFIDQDAPLVDERFAVQLDSINKSKFRSMNVSVAIEVDKKAELTMIVDKGNGDYLKLKGEAQLIAGIDESGKTTLTGRYALKEGYYEMTFNFLKRKFEIKDGSYILWTGEPTSADINIIAMYKSLTAPIDLLGNQLGNVSTTVRNTYKQRIPFETLLKMKGQLLSPEISFDIVLPEGNYNVSSEIVTNTRTKLEQLRQQPDELNKQVFALLLLNRFIGENPFASEAGTGTESLARQSVSKILSQQLNNLAADLVKGVEVDLNLESSDDYTTGIRENRTDLNVGVSKQLLNDRLKVTVGSSFGIEGPAQANREATNIAGDVSLNYQLSKDGRYMLRAYRKNEYQMALQGQVIETGLAFTIIMDYNKFRELFHRSEEEKEIKRTMKGQRKVAREKEKEVQKYQEQTNDNQKK